MMKIKILLLASLLTLVSACLPGANAAPTLYPPEYIPTVVAMTGQAILLTSNAMTAAVTPSETPQPTETPIPSTSLPTLTPTLAPGFTEYAQIRFIAPGPMSSLTSPIRLQLMLVSGRSEIVKVDLLGENGALLQRGIERVNRNLSGNYRSFEMAFEIRAVSERGYIRISSKDDFGRIENLNTMPVLLYSIGDTQINPVGNMIYERVSLDGLEDGDEISGGVVNLKGRLWPFNETPFFIEMLSEEGVPISARVLNMNGIDTQEFETTLPYKVTEPTRVRLTFRQDSPALGDSDPDLKKLIYVYTMELVLKP
jgi:hypothetical protein